MGSIEHEIEVSATPYECYTWWRNLTNLGEVMDEVIEVVALDPDARRTHWAVEGPLGRSVEWDAEIVEERAPHLLSWRSVESSIQSRGSVVFTPSGECTLVGVSLEWHVPAGGLGEAVARAVSSPRKHVERAMESFKERIEAAGSPVADDPVLTGRGGGVRNRVDLPTIVEHRVP